MIDEIATLTDEQFLELCLVIYDMGRKDADNLDNVGQRLRRIRIRVEEWLEM